MKVIKSSDINSILILVQTSVWLQHEFSNWSQLILFSKIFYFIVRKNISWRWTELKRRCRKTKDKRENYYFLVVYKIKICGSAEIQSGDLSAMIGFKVYALDHSTLLAPRWVFFYLSFLVWFRDLFVILMHFMFRPCHSFLGLWAISFYSG